MISYFLTILNTGASGGQLAAVWMLLGEVRKLHRTFAIHVKATTQYNPMRKPDHPPKTRKDSTHTLRCHILCYPKWPHTCMDGHC